MPTRSRFRFLQGRHTLLQDHDTFVTHGDRLRREIPSPDSGQNKLPPIVVGACDVIVFTAGVLTGGRVIDAPQVVAFKVASFDAVAYFAGRDAVRSLLRDDVAFLSRCDTSSESFVLGADGALLGYGCLATAPEEDSTNLASSPGAGGLVPASSRLDRWVFALPGQ